MSDHVCECGKDCRSKLMLDKHRGVCASVNRFTNRFTVNDRCPKCSMFDRSFFIKDMETYVCLDCGVHFTPKGMLEELRGESAKLTWRRG